MDKKEVWSLEHNWTDDNQIGMETRLFENFDDAKAAFEKLIADLKQDAWGGVIDKDGNAQDGYCIEKSILSFIIYRVEDFPMSYEAVCLSLHAIN